MKNITRHSGKLVVGSRMPQSTNGNPRFIVSVDGFTCRTAPDSPLGYDVQSLNGRYVQATIGTYYGHATLDSLAVDNTNIEIGINLETMRNLDAFTAGTEDTFEIDDVLSMWRVDGVVYAVGRLGCAPYTHNNCILHYAKIREAPDADYTSSYHMHPRTAAFNGRHVGPDEVLTIHIEEIKCLEN